MSQSRHISFEEEEGKRVSGSFQKQEYVPYTSISKELEEMGLANQTVSTLKISTRLSPTSQIKYIVHAIYMKVKRFHNNPKTYHPALAQALLIYEKYKKAEPLRCLDLRTRDTGYNIICMQ